MCSTEPSQIRTLQTSSSPTRQHTLLLVMRLSNGPSLDVRLWPLSWRLHDCDLHDSTTLIGVAGLPVHSVDNDCLCE